MNLVEYLFPSHLHQVEDLSSVTGLLTSQEVFSEHGFSSVVCCDCDWDQLKALDALCRRSTVPLVSAGVRGSCGYVFNDFHSDFVVEDVDGELYKEVLVREEEDGDGSGDGIDEHDNDDYSTDYNHDCMMMVMPSSLIYVLTLPVRCLCSPYSMRSTRQLPLAQMRSLSR